MPSSIFLPASSPNATSSTSAHASTRGCYIGVGDMLALNANLDEQEEAGRRGRRRRTTKRRKEEEEEEKKNGERRDAESPPTGHGPMH